MWKGVNHLNKTMSTLKGSALALKMLFVIIFGGEGIHFVVNTILALANINTNPEVSSGNVFTSFLAFMPIVLHLYMFKRMMHIGSSRRNYYSGLIVTYILMASTFSIFNIIWLGLEKNVFVQFKTYFNYIDIFNWGRYGVVGLFIYQFSAYMLIIAFFNMLCSFFRNKIGIALYFLLAAVIAVSMSIGQLRGIVVELLHLLLFSPNLLLGVIITALISILFFATGWWFVKRWEISN